jgi:hypothetical protein
MRSWKRTSSLRESFCLSTFSALAAVTFRVFDALMP